MYPNNSGARAHPPERGYIYKNSNAPVPQKIWLRRFKWTLIIVFTFIIGGLFLIDMQTIHNSTLDLAINEARANFMKDQAFRLWVTSHGGLYVPTDDRTPPNPYLSHIPEQNITTPAARAQ